MWKRHKKQAEKSNAGAAHAESDARMKQPSAEEELVADSAKAAALGGALGGAPGAAVGGLVGLLGGYKKGSKKDSYW